MGGKEEINRQVKFKFRQGLKAVLNHLSSLISTDPKFQSQNRKNSERARNENHDRSHSQECVLGDGISHGSRFGIRQIFPVLNAFRRFGDLFAVVPQCGTKEKSLVKVDQSVKSVLFAPPPPCELKLFPLPANFNLVGSRTFCGNECIEFSAISVNQC